METGVFADVTVSLSGSASAAVGVIFQCSLPQSYSLQLKITRQLLFLIRLVRTPFLSILGVSFFQLHFYISFSIFLSISHM